MRILRITLFIIILLVIAGCGIMRGPARLPSDAAYINDVNNVTTGADILFDTAANIAKNSMLELILLFIGIILFLRLKFPPHIFETNEDAIYGDIMDLKNVVDDKEWHFDDLNR